MSYGKSQLNRNCHIILAAVITGGVIGFGTFATEARGRGRVIEFGWDTPTIPWLCENAAITECTIAFDGIILDLAQREGQGSLSWIAWATNSIPFDVQQNAEEDIELLNDANFTRLRENSFFRLNSSGWSAPPDWFDADFNTVVSNITFMASAVNQTALAGIAFDPEDYFSNCWHYPSRKYSATKTFEQYQAQVRQRGAEIASAIKSACPGRDFVMLFTFANSLPYISTQWWGHPLSEDSYGLLPAFIDGLLDEAGEQIRLIDGIESAYPNKTLAEFQGSISNYQGGASLSADPSRYLSCVGIGFGTWMDYRSNDFGWYTNPNEFNLNHFTPETFNQAMDISTDLAELSWVYTEIPDWYLGTVPEAYFNALADVTGLPPVTSCIELWARLLRAKDPFPADAAQNVHPNVVLSWQAGIKAASHDVYFGNHFNDVNDANRSNHPNVYYNNVDANSHDPCILELDTAYHWRVDEVNGPNTWKGDVWSFTVVPHLVVDDMESYNEFDNLIRDTWLDMYYNWTGAWLYLWIDPCEPVHAGRQSMKYDYDNTGGWWGDLHYYSEIERTFADPCDWSVSGIKVLTLYFYGDPDNDANAGEQTYVGLQDSSGADSYAEVRYGHYGEDMNNIKIAEWQEWNIRLQDFNDGGVDLKDVSKIYIGFSDRSNLYPGGTPGGSGVVYFDDIRLYPPKCVPSLAKSAADFDNNCIVDSGDFAILANQWKQPPGSPSADIAEPLDGFVNWKDLDVLTESWLEVKLWPPEE